MSDENNLLLSHAILDLLRGFFAYLCAQTCRMKEEHHGNMCSGHAFSGNRHWAPSIHSLIAQGSKKW